MTQAGETVLRQIPRNRSLGAGRHRYGKRMVCYTIIEKGGWRPRLLGKPHSPTSRLWPPVPNDPESVGAGGATSLRKHLLLLFHAHPSLIGVWVSFKTTLGCQQIGPTDGGPKQPRGLQKPLRANWASVEQYTLSWFCKPDRELSPGPKSASTLILEFQPPETWEISII